ncbi:MAG TPA: hypothetical protein VES73_05875 [Lamprocystis sp. (in: g-proteobacteria)]|nr:hypothetical protein [Lamprocystis sp. (in: g-proteobacteria)]
MSEQLATLKAETARTHDTKATIQVRLSPQAVAELDHLVAVRQASGRAEVLETLLAAPTARDALTLAARHLRQSGLPRSTVPTRRGP